MIESRPLLLPLDWPDISNFRPIDRDTGFLLPSSVDEWLPERHLARFVVEVIDGLDVSAMSKSYRGAGSASYHCGPACKKDPVSGVIGVQKGPLISMV